LALIAMPRPRPPIRKSREAARSRRGLPRNGTWNAVSPSATVMKTSNSPMPRYGTSLPRTTSTASTGVAASCSMLPRSHSRAIVNEVSIAEMIIITTATSPGTMVTRLSRSSSYQTRTRADPMGEAPCSVAV